MKHRHGAYIAAFAVLCLALPVLGLGDEIRLHWDSPCLQADSVRCDTLGSVVEVGLAAQVVHAVRFFDNDTLYLGEIPEVGKECRRDSAAFEFLPGTMGAILMRSRDMANNLSCTYSSYVFAMPASDATPGLLGSYFSDQNLTQLFATTVDPLINFDWGTESALAGMPPDWFSVRWTGKIRTQAAGLYTFRIAVNDAARLWIGATMPIDNWAGDGYHSASGVTNLAADSSYDIRLEMMERTGSARISLYWVPPSGTEELVPASSLSH